MKTKSHLLILPLILLILAGCGTAGGLFKATPIVSTDTNGVSHTNGILYTPNPALTNTVEQVKQVAAVIPSPYTGIIEGGLALLSAVLAGIAKYKTDQSAAHASAADTLAGVVVQSGQSIAAIKNAIGTTGATALAQHLDNNTTLTA